MYNLFVGIDVSKSSFSVTGLDPKGNVCFSIGSIIRIVSIMGCLGSG